MSDTYASLVARVGRALYGPSWVIDMHRESGWAVRTLERIKAADAAGGDYPSAKGLLDGLQLLIDRHQERTAALRVEVDAARARRTAERQAKDGVKP